MSYFVPADYSHPQRRPRYGSPWEVSELEQYSVHPELVWGLSDPSLEQRRDADPEERVHRRHFCCLAAGACRQCQTISYHARIVRIEARLVRLAPVLGPLSLGRVCSLDPTTAGIPALLGSLAYCAWLWQLRESLLSQFVVGAGWLTESTSQRKETPYQWDRAGGYVELTGWLGLVRLVGWAGLL